MGVVTLLYIAYVGSAIVMAPIVTIILIVFVGVAAHFYARKASAAAAAMASRRVGLLDQTVSALDAVKVLNAPRFLDGIWNSRKHCFGA